MLLAAGADVNAKGPNDETPLRVALDQGRPQGISDILRQHGRTE